MEKLKDPAMLLAAANTIGIVGTTAYFYKQFEALRLDMVKISTTLTKVVQKIAEMEKGGQHKDEALHTLNQEIKTFKDRLNEIPSLDIIDDIDTDLDELIITLSEHDIDVERPSKAPRRRSGERRVPPASRRVEEEDRREDRRDVSRRGGRTSGYGSSDRSREENRPAPRNQNRETRPSTVRNEPRTDPPINTGNYDDDSDISLIDAVRRQQPRN